MSMQRTYTPMNQLQYEAYDLVESTLKEQCYFMTGTFKPSNAHRSTPPPEQWAKTRLRLTSSLSCDQSHVVVGSRRSARLDSLRDASTSSSMSLLLKPSESHQKKQLQQHAGDQSSASPLESVQSRTPMSVASSTSAPATRNNSIATTPKTWSWQSSVERKRARRKCKQCGQHSDSCDGAKTIRGGSNNCNYKCELCQHGPLLCQCRSPPADQSGTDAATAAAANRAAASAKADTALGNNENARVLPSGVVRRAGTAKLATASTKADTALGNNDNARVLPSGAVRYSNENRLNEVDAAVRVSAKAEMASGSNDNVRVLSSGAVLYKNEIRRNEVDAAVPRKCTTKMPIIDTTTAAAAHSHRESPVHTTIKNPDLDGVGLHVEQEQDRITSAPPKCSTGPSCYVDLGLPSDVGLLRETSEIAFPKHATGLLSKGDAFPMELTGLLSKCASSQQEAEASSTGKCPVRSESPATTRQEEDRHDYATASHYHQNEGTRRTTADSDGATPMTSRPMDAEELGDDDGKSMSPAAKCVNTEHVPARPGNETPNGTGPSCDLGKSVLSDRYDDSDCGYNDCDDFDSGDGNDEDWLPSTMYKYKRRKRTRERTQHRSHAQASTLPNALHHSTSSAPAFVGRACSASSKPCGETMQDCCGATAEDEEEIRSCDEVCHNSHLAHFLCTCVSGYNSLVVPLPIVTTTAPHLQPPETAYNESSNMKTVFSSITNRCVMESKGSTKGEEFQGCDVRTE